MFSMALAILTIFDYWLLAEGKRAGWVVGMAIQPLWVILGLSADQPGLILMSVVYFVINMRGFINHGRNK